MPLQKELVHEGNRTDYPKKGDNVAIEYTGWLYDANASSNKFRGDKFDSSVDRPGDFETPIGVGRVIKGWDEGVPQMSLGEKSVLTIPGDMAYGQRGFPGLIPPNATLIFHPTSPPPTHRHSHISITLVTLLYTIDNLTDELVVDASEVELKALNGKRA